MKNNPKDLLHIFLVSFSHLDPVNFIKRSAIIIFIRDIDSNNEMEMWTSTRLWSFEMNFIDKISNEIKKMLYEWLKNQNLSISRINKNSFALYNSKAIIIVNVFFSFLFKSNLKNCIRRDFMKFVSYLIFFWSFRVRYWLTINWFPICFRFIIDYVIRWP